MSDNPKTGPVAAAALARLRGATQLVLLLDYDGTLVEFTANPADAAPDAALLDLLSRLAARPATGIHVVSGRPRDTLGGWLGHLPIHLHAEHGFWSRPLGGGWQSLPAGPTPWRAPALAILREYAARTPGTLIEEKSVGLAWHYRMADPELGMRQADRLSMELAERFGGQGVEVLRGEMVVELRPVGIHKGVVARQVAGEIPPGALIAALGDDLTDEDLFAALPPAPASIAIHVGPRPSRAPVRLRDVAEARAFLERLLAD
jgi:trehalose 6-phosphate synthase/phosphatase